MVSNFKSGFSLIELILLIALIGIVALLSTPFYSRFLLRNAVENTTSEILGSLRKAQLYSMTGKENSNWGIHYSTNTVTLYKGSSFGEDPNFNESFGVNPNVAVTSFTDLNFTKSTGIPGSGNPSTSPTITVKSGNTIRKIIVNTQGVADRAPADITPPTAAQNTLATTISSTKIDLTWQASTDNEEVTGYDIYRDGILINSVSGTTLIYHDTNLLPSTNYSYYVVAIDSSGNSSQPSNNSQASTDPPPNIQFIASTSSSSTSNNTISGSFTLPSGWQPGDVAVFWWYTYANNKTISPPATITQKQQTSSSGFGRIYIGYRVLQSGDSSFAWTSSSVNQSTTVWGTSVFRDVVTSGDPFEAQSGTPATFTNTLSPNPPAVTTLSSNAMVIPIYGKRDDFTTITPPTNYSSAGSNDSTSGDDASAGAAYFKRVTTGSEDPVSWTLTGGSTANSDGYVWTGALKQALD